MAQRLGIRELRQNLSKYVERAKAGENFEVTEQGRVVARLVPAGTAADAYAELAARFGTSVPLEPLEVIAARLSAPGAPAGTTDAHLAQCSSGR